MKVVEQFGFCVNIFIYILEGYKVVDKMVVYGVGGLSFFDWWVYKYEVQEVIFYNGVLMYEQGVMVVFNLDDVEMACCFNQEVVKVVFFGGVFEEDVLKFVILNFVKFLYLDEYVGSIKVGKYVDVVFWFGYFLFMYSWVEKIFIDGIFFFDWAVDLEARKDIVVECYCFIQLMLDDKKNGGKIQKVSS